VKLALPIAPKHERKLILLFCAIAAFRVLIFSAAFPFFNNVDEQAHVDLVMKYARGEMPRDLGHYSSESAHYLSLYGTPEYFRTPEQFNSGRFPPPNWTLPAEQRDALVNGAAAWWQTNPNHESGEPPLYYALAGLWLDLGHVFGMTGGWLLYWVRFLNVVAGAVLVWIGFVAAKLVFPEGHFMRLSVPLFLAIWPQTTFYSVASDSLSPICFGIAFVGLLKILQADRPSLLVATWTGLALAASCLAKTTNIALLFVVGFVLILRIINLRASKTIPRLLASFAVLAACAALPVALWFAWNLHTFGDLTATESKIELLGWTRKPIGDWFSHPIFTFQGFGEFWPELIASFWRGEFIWHGVRLASPVMDGFYWISSTFATLLTVVCLVWPPSKLTDLQRRDLWVALSSFAVLVLFLVAISIAYDFGPCPYPSREHPYFTSGRLLSAAAVPFFIFYAYALDRVLSWIPAAWPRWILLSGIVLFLAVSQCVLNWPAFSSQHNFFHLHEALS
jgi:predicted membrane protein DUF2142